MKNLPFSKIAILVTLIICIWYGKNLDTWGKNRVIQNDVIMYYAYLPATFIFHDLDFDFVKDLPKDFEGQIWLQRAPSGNTVIRMTMGLSVLWLPFFFLAHGLAHLLGVSTLGYSWPYSLSIFVAAIFYLFVGLYYLRKILLRYFTDFVTAVTLTLVVFATNLMHYVISEPGMSHVYNFALISAFLYFSMKWTEAANVKNTIILGLLAGLIVLVRPVNILVLIFPALIGVSSMKELTNRITQNWKWIIVAGVFSVLVFVPQMIYWKVQTGHFFFNSYMDQGKFYFLRPQIINGLFSYRKGWLLYTPVMVFAFLGFIWLKKYVSGFLIPILIFAVVNIYVVFSWWCWWYGGSFGARPMIDMYGIMALPLAAFIQFINEKKNWLKAGVAAVLIAFIFLNQFQMIQYRSSLLHWNSMTKEAYWGIFGRRTWPPGYDKMIKAPDTESALKGEKEY